MATTKIKGSCLCGAVHYELQGSPKKFFHCHCSRCRKATGTGHASNLFVEAGGITWTAAEDTRRTFNLPGAERFSTHFCTTCGSLLPRELPQSNIVMIPAGSLDCDVDCMPQARIFVGSRTRWSCDETQGVPRFDEYPA